MKKSAFLFFCFVFFLCNNLFAWGTVGHKITAGICKSVLKKNIIDSVQFYLENTSFEEAAVWMDEVRKNHKYDYLKPKHYINIEKDNTYVKVEGSNIVNELESVISLLQNHQNISRAETKMALLILFHLMGDLHQPLHVGYGADKGGNDMHLIYKNKKTNLHHLWDTEIIENQKIDLSTCLNHLNALSKSQKKVIQKIDVIDWMNDSRNYLKNVYDFKTKEIDDAYSSKNASIISSQLVKAGIRLATVLENCFGK